MNAVRKWIRQWTTGQFFLFTLAVVALWFVGMVKFSDGGLHPELNWLRLVMWASVIVWFFVGWQWFGRKRNG